MKFSYQGTANLYDGDCINIVQPINPFTGEVIKDKNDALLWAKQHILSTYHCGLIYFEAEVQEQERLVDQECRILIKESTGVLTGKYDIKIKNLNECINKKVEFMDGEALFKITFREAAEYEIILENVFKMGEMSYMALVDESLDVDPLSVEKYIADNKLIIVVSKKEDKI